MALNGADKLRKKKREKNFHLYIILDRGERFRRFQSERRQRNARRRKDGVYCVLHTVHRPAENATVGETSHASTATSPVTRRCVGRSRSHALACTGQREPEREHHRDAP